MIQEKDLVFNMAALREFKKLTGQSPFNADFSDPDAFSVLAYCALNQGKYEREGITQEEVDKMLTYNDLTTVAVAFRKSYQKINELSDEPTESEKK